MLDGTPVYDVKPYVPAADAPADPAEGYTAETRTHALAVRFEPAAAARIPEALLPALTGVLAGDPRPGYDDDPGKVYGLAYAGLDVGFRVENGVLTVFRADPVPGGGLA